MSTNLCRSTHICVWGGEIAITATTPELRWMAMSRIVIRIDLAISYHQATRELLGRVWKARYSRGEYTSMLSGFLQTWIRKPTELELERSDYSHSFCYRHLV